MKQYITQEQWNELDDSSKIAIRGSSTKYTDMNIGQMIEFLGDDLECMEFEDGIWLVIRRYFPHADRTEWEGKSLCDALWEAVKHKLNHPQEDMVELLK